jgi:hypothetical protein
MKPSITPFCRNVLTPALALLALAPALSAQVFTNHGNGDLTLGFRKTGNFAGSTEVVVNVGHATNFVNQALGTTVPVTGYVTSQLVTNSFTNFNNLNWSAFGDVHNSQVSGYPSGTLWLSNPRSTFGVQTAPPDREIVGLQQDVVGKIESILNGASDISGRLGASNTLNTTTLVGEPVNNNNIVQGENLSVYIASPEDSTQGTFDDTWADDNGTVINVENITPGSFTSPQQSDLYEIRPTGNTDPHTLSKTGSAYFVGFFQLNTDGSMTFTRASSVATAPAITLTRNGNTSSISFSNVSGTVYTLHGTNLSGIGVAVTNWPVLGSSITGTGGITNFVDTTTDPNRIYRVGAH